MSDIHPHQLHQMMRSWLLAEDPYGLNQRIEPTMGTQSPPGAPAPGGAGSAPSAPAGGTAAAVEAAAPALRAQNYGRGAVQRELEKNPTPNVNSEGFQAARDPRAQAWGESAVDKALNPPTGSGGGFWAPGEAAETAGAVGEQAVGAALAKKARGKVAKGRLTDPQDPDDRQPE